MLLSRQLNCACLSCFVRWTLLTFALENGSLVQKLVSIYGVLVVELSRCWKNSETVQYRPLCRCSSWVCLRDHWFQGPWFVLKSPLSFGHDDWEHDHCFLGDLIQCCQIPNPYRWCCRHSLWKHLWILVRVHLGSHESRRFRVWRFPFPDHSPSFRDTQDLSPIPNANRWSLNFRRLLLYFELTLSTLESEREDFSLTNLVVPLKFDPQLLTAGCDDHLNSLSDLNDVANPPQEWLCLTRPWPMELSELSWLVMLLFSSVIQVILGQSILVIYSSVFWGIFLPKPRHFTCPQTVTSNLHEWLHNLIGNG